jgi:formylmethanofuran dehydrogenase subunit E
MHPSMMPRKEKIDMDVKQIMGSEEFRRCADFHGHICPGLSIGYKAAKMAMESLKERRSEDEEVVAVVETDACYADAVQVLTGCTFGKGNFIYKDHGKMVLRLLSRKTGQGVRVAMRPGSFSPDETHLSLLRKVMSGDADQDETNRFKEISLVPGGFIITPRGIFELCHQLHKVQAIFADIWIQHPG